MIELRKIEVITSILQTTKLRLLQLDIKLATRTHNHPSPSSLILVTRNPIHLDA